MGKTLSFGRLFLNLQKIISQMTYSSYSKLYGLIGYPLGHSFSQDYFNRKFDAENIDARYINFEIPEIGDLRKVLITFFSLLAFW